MSHGQALAVAVVIGVWCFALAALFDRRWTRWALSRADQGPEATRKMVRRSQLRWLGAWLVVWVFGIALSKGDPNNREAGVVVVPMVLAHGPRALWHIWSAPRDLIEKGADPEVARAVVRGATPLAILGLLLCLAAMAVAFGS